MSNIITFNAPQRSLGFQDQAASLISLFATQRRGADDVFWLKENAELLSILECSGTKLDAKALAPHAEFYETLPERLSFFPQYYRFLLSICLDLEDLGIAGNQGEILCNWVAQQRLVAAELSDLQRGEAQRLLARRGILPCDTGLDDRLRQFITRSETFAVPNKKAAYELTHIVFYLSEYGRKDPQLNGDAIRSLQFAGILAYLDQNTDLLAEICLSLRFAGQRPSKIWEDHVTACLSDFAISGTKVSPATDQYHEFFVASWMSICAKRPALLAPIQPGTMRFDRKSSRVGPLRNISACMYQLRDARSSDWPRMRGIFEQSVSPEGYEILCAAQESSPEFEAFFEGFSRMNVAG
jgi:hypothetical protein